MPTATPALSETKVEKRKDEELYTLRELKAATGYSKPTYESPTHSSDENQGKDKDKNINAAVLRDRERQDDKKDQAQRSASLDKEREGKRWKGSEDRTDEIVFAKDEWMEGQILLKLDGKGVDDAKQKGRLDETHRKGKEKELGDERIRRKEKQRLYREEQETQLNRDPRAANNQDRQKQQRFEEEQRICEKRIRR
ncbi:octapeptide-repeat protein T2-like [Ambystoma mexicanum]|uniref:octapeptide-repeat protein T2-like n=1 Tax=Ambystoma mexicanum TaxID=8296 RepID=UPI0037E7507C